MNFSANLDLSSKKRKRDLISSDSSSVGSGASTSDILLMQARNPVKRLRRQLEDLQVQSQIMTSKGEGGPIGGIRSLENSAYVQSI